MTYGVKLRVRRYKPTGTYYAGFASEIRLGKYEDINGGDFGTWQGSQMSYSPFLQAVEDAYRLAERLNEENEETI